MEFKDFESCKNCNAKGRCKKPCEKFLYSPQMDEIDKQYWSNGLRVDMSRQVEGNKKTEEFKVLKKNLLSKISLQQTIKCAEEGERFKEGKVIQKTDSFIVIKETEGAKRPKTINFLDIYTRDIIISY